MSSTQTKFGNDRPRIYLTEEEVVFYTLAGYIYYVSSLDNIHLFNKDCRATVCGVKVLSIFTALLDMSQLFNNPLRTDMPITCDICVDFVLKKNEIARE